MPRILLLSALLLVAAVGIVTLYRRPDATSTQPVLEVRRVAPEGEVLIGEPNTKVIVELELKNISHKELRLAAPQLSCSCFIETAPDNVLPAGGTTRCTLSFRYPPFHESNIPVTFTDVSGQLLAETAVVLKANIVPPYFMNCPDFLEISVIEGAADKSWSTGIAVAELAGTPPFIQSASMQTVTKDVEVELLPPVDSQSAGTLTQRTYELRFTPRDAAGTTIDESRGIVKMNLTDQSSQSIPWRLMRQLPIKLFYDRAKGEVRGLRRSNVQGKVLLKLHPVEAGSLTNYEFEADDTIVSIVKLKAELTDTAPPPVSVEAIFSGTRDVSVVLPLQ